MALEGESAKLINSPEKIAMSTGQMSSVRVAVVVVVVAVKTGMQLLTFR